MPFTVYILYSKKLNKFYKGQTNNLQSRLKRHNSGHELSTQNGIPWTLIWTTVKESRSDAVILERKLKNLSKAKLIDFMLNYESGISSPDELLFLKQLSGC